MILLHSVKNIFRSEVSKQIRKGMRPQILLKSNIDNPIVFCIVHWNAPDFLLLTVNQIELLYPNSNIYILDNGSRQNNLTFIKDRLQKFNNVTLFVSLGPPKWTKKFGLDTLFEWQSHTAGLQFLLNYCAKQPHEIAIFLDQDCIITKRVDDLIDKLSKNIILIGARDRWRGHAAYYLVHPSFMILQPKRIRHLFGVSSFYDKRTESLETYARDPYHGISLKTLGRILYLEPRKHDKIPLLTSYTFNETVFAWHAWYSSRTINADSSSIDGYPVSWLQDVRKMEYDFMMQVHRNTVAKLKVL